MAQNSMSVRAAHQLPDGTRVEREVSSEQLHEHACVVCGTVTGHLAPYGYVYTECKDGGELGWPVRACAADRGVAA